MQSNTATILPKYQKPIQVKDININLYYQKLMTYLQRFTPQLVSFCTDLFRVNHADSFSIFNDAEIDTIFQDQNLYYNVFRNRNFEPSFKCQNLSDFIQLGSQLILPRFYVSDLPIQQANSTLQYDVYQKKVHEILIFYKFISTYLPDQTNYTYLDLGAGKGYLSAFLGFERQLSTIGIEASEKHCISLARYLDQTLMKFDKICYYRYFSMYASRYLQQEVAPIYEKLSLNPGYIAADTTAQDIIRTQVKYEDFRKKYLNIKTKDLGDHHVKSNNIQGNSAPFIEHLQSTYDQQNQQKTCALGLHACGNLSAVALKLKANAAFTVPCCYAHLSEEQFPLCKETENILRVFIGEIKQFFPNYPVNKKFSSFLMELPKQILSYATMDFDEEMEKIQRSILSFHYRAILEFFKPTDEKQIIEVNRDFEAAQIVEWICKNTGANSKDVELKVEELESQKWKTAAHMLCRQFCGMVMETLVLVDRLLYLQQHGIEGSIQSMLHGISARGFCLWYNDK